MVFRSSRDRHLGGRVPRRGAAPGRSGARLAGGAARRREGLRHLPRDGRERLRALEDVRAHRRRALARARPSLRSPCARAGRAARGHARAKAILAVDRRRRSCALSRPTAWTRALAIRSSTRGSEPRELAFRPMVADDLRLLHDWLQRPHVRRWYAERGTYEDVVAHYLPAIEGTDPTDHYLVLLDGRPVGMLQTYLVSDHPAYAELIGISDSTTAGVDILIGEEELDGPGARHRGPPPLRRRSRVRAAGDDVLRRRSRRAEHRVAARVREGGLPRRADVRRPGATGRRTRSCGWTAQGAQSAPR